MKEENFKYYFKGQGFKNKRTYGRAIVESQLSEYGKQVMENLINEGATSISDAQGVAIEAALKQVYVGFKSNDVKKPLWNLDELAEQTNPANYIYLIAYGFVAGGAIITLGSEHLNEKMTNASSVSLTAKPVESEIDPNAPEYKEPAQEDAYEPMRGISQDFRVRD